MCDDVTPGIVIKHNDPSLEYCYLQTWFLCLFGAAFQCFQRDACVCGEEVLLDVKRGKLIIDAGESALLRHRRVNGSKHTKGCRHFETGLSVIAPLWERINGGVIKNNCPLWTGWSSEKVQLQLSCETSACCEQTQGRRALSSPCFAPNILQFLDFKATDSQRQHE